MEEIFPDDAQVDLGSSPKVIENDTTTDSMDLD